MGAKRPYPIAHTQTSNGGSAMSPEARKDHDLLLRVECKFAREKNLLHGIVWVAGE